MGHNPDQPLALGLDTNLADTICLRQGLLKAKAVLGTNAIMAIDGVPGTGKTTCARLVAQTAARPSALVRMSHRPKPTELLRRTVRAITGIQPSAKDTRFEMQEQLLRILEPWGGVLIIDELQYSQVDAMQELTWLYEESDRSFAIVVVGTNVLTAAKKYPQLNTRILTEHTFYPLRDDGLISAVTSLDDRLANADPALLHEHDNAKCFGLLRRWVQTVTWLNELGFADTVDASSLADVRSVMTTITYDDSIFADPDPSKAAHRRRSRASRRAA